MKPEAPKANLPKAGEDDRRILRRDPNPHLFRPMALRSVTARNRIMLSPMCQYSATDGAPNLWHMQHLGSRAVGGAGIVSTEVTHVEARGRITPHCLGIWNDAQRDAFAPIAAFIAAQGAVPAIQLGHAGRKASVARPWDGNKPIVPENGGWTAIGPSAVPFGNFPVPKPMNREDIAAVLAAFRAAARRAREAGFKLIEVHGAHGYLLHEFLSPLSNTRSDHYGGPLEDRARLLMETLDAIRAEWPMELPLALRLSCTDWVAGGFALDDAVAVARLVAARGDVDFIDCSSGGSDPAQQIPVHPGYQVGFAERIRREAGIATAAVGLIHSPDMAEEILANGRADLVVLGRTLLGDPFWPLRAARTLKAANVKWPVQYERADIF
jgi:2,4-dienoyl-CoA reductase-like NADH-dependent reductase (Old Yellow Enzyme family)